MESTVMEFTQEVVNWVHDIKDGAGWCTDGYIINIVVDLPDNERYQLMIAMAEEKLLIDEDKIDEDGLNNEDINLIPKEAFMSIFQVVKAYYESHSGLPMFTVTPEGKEAMERYNKAFDAVEELLSLTNSDMQDGFDIFIRKIAGNDRGYIENVITLMELYDGPHNHRGLGFMTEVDVIDQIGEDAISDLLQEEFLHKEITDPTILFMEEVRAMFSNDTMLDSDFPQHHITQLSSMPQELMQKFMDNEDRMVRIGILDSGIR